MRDMLYFDSAATTRMDDRVLTEMLPYFSEQFGNPSSIHGFGRSVKVAVERARVSVAALLGAAPAEIVFTSGGTEADNLALHTAIIAGNEVGKRHIITSKAEHEAILKPLARYAREGYDVTYLDVSSNGAVDLKSVEQALREDTALVTLMHANNETGGYNPIEHIAEMTRAHGALFHTDAVQSGGKAPFSVRSFPVDMISLSAHKIYGPKGIGALFVRAGLELEPLLLGGSQERGRRGGTENVPAIVGFGVAARFALEEMDARMARWTALQGQFRAFCEEHFPEAILNSSGDSIASICSISFPYRVFRIDGETLVMNMDMEGIAVSSGSACTAGSVEASHVMRAIGHDPETAKATLRFSFGKETTSEQLDRALHALRDVVQRMRT